MNRTMRLTIRLTVDELKEIDEAAIRSGKWGRCPTSRWAREVLVTAAMDTAGDVGQTSRRER